MPTTNEGSVFRHHAREKPVPMHCAGVRRRPEAHASRML
jgi:hypothetical protein